MPECLLYLLGALGVVFGDIGTSPLYAIREIFSIGNNILALNEANMLGNIILNILVASFNCFI
jgi:K+ transporter